MFSQSLEPEKSQHFSNTHKTRFDFAAFFVKMRVFVSLIT